MRRYDGEGEEWWAKRLSQRQSKEVRNKKRMGDEKSYVAKVRIIWKILFWRPRAQSV
jgi:hypothetical protein